MEAESAKETPVTHKDEEDQGEGDAVPLVERSKQQEG